MYKAPEINNYLGFYEVNGEKLRQAFLDHIQAMEINIKREKIDNIFNQGQYYQLISRDNTFKANTVVLGVGASNEKYLEGEERLLGKGVSYCATCDAGFYRNQEALVVGGGNSALTAALLLSEFAKKVYISYRREEFFRASPAWKKQVEDNEKIEVLFNTELKEIFGDKVVQGIEFKDGKKINFDGVFIELGTIPRIKLSRQMGVEMEEGYIKINKDQKTNVPGVFAAGDVTNNNFKQVITACSEGAKAVFSAYKELGEENE
jgi:thioredoxin reductase (NADPH)